MILDPSPCVVPVLYHETSGTVKHSNNIALKIMEIHVLRTVEVHHGRPTLGVVVEMHVVAALLQVGEQRPVVGIVRSRAVDHLLRPHAVVPVLELNGGAAPLHLPQLTPCLPYTIPAEGGKRDS